MIRNMIWREDFVRLNECIAEGGQEEARRFLLNLLIIRKMNIDFSVRYENLKRMAAGAEEDPVYYSMYQIPFLSRELRWDRLRDSDGISEKRLRMALREICEQSRGCQGILDLSEAWTNVSRKLRETAFEVFGKLQIDEEHDREVSEMFEFVLSRTTIASRGQGEFYTPAGIGQIMAELLQPESGTVYDPCCGSGSLLAKAAAYGQQKSREKRPNMKLYGQEASREAWSLAKMNLLLKGMDVDLGDRAENVFAFDLHEDLRADYIMSNPPFHALDPSRPLWAGDPRWMYGLPPRRKSGFAWIQHMLYHLNANGKMACVLSASTLEGGTKAEQMIRTRMIEDDVISAVILLPPGLFYATKITTALWIIEKNKNSMCRNRILFINGKKMGRTERGHTRLPETETARICSVWKAYQTGEGSILPDIAAVGDREEIRAKEFSLLPDRYIRKKAEQLPAYSELEQEERRNLEKLRMLAYKNRETLDEIEKGFRSILE